jgi:hypothetical protein
MKIALLRNNHHDIYILDSIAKYKLIYLGRKGIKHILLIYIIEWKQKEPHYHLPWNDERQL